MEYFDLLLFLALPGLVFSQNCLTNDTKANVGLDVNKTTTINTSVVLISELFNWGDEETCITTCCNSYESEGCTIAEFDRGNNTCRLYKSNCKQSENCILKQAAYKTLTFVKKTGITTVSPKLSDNENKNDVTNAIDTTNSAARIENVKESDNHSNATINATLNSSNKHAIVSNITNNRMDNGTELNPSKSSSNKTEGVKSEINSTDSSVNTTAETSLQSLSNKTNAWSTVPSSIKETNEIQTAHNDAHITSTAAYVNNATNITPAAQNANNATNKTIDQHVNNSTLTKSVTAYVNNATDETKTVPKPTTGSPTQTSGMGKLDNQSSVVTTEVTEIPSVNYTVSSNNVQNKTNNISSIHIANTTTSAPENITGIGININVTTTPFAANSANGTATEKANHELLPSGTNETMKQRNMTVQSLVNTTSNPLSASEKTTKVSPDTAEGTTGLVHTTESPVHNVSRTTTATNNTTVSHRNENISSTTLDHGGTTIPVTNTTKVSTNKDGFSKPNLTSTITISEGEKTTQTYTTTTTIQPQVRFHYPHFESPESAAMSGALIAAVSFGVIFLFSVLVLVGKRVFDSWQRRHYSRMDFLINGMYN